jgi:hypothetical protein
MDLWVLTSTLRYRICNTYNSLKIGNKGIANYLCLSRLALKIVIGAREQGTGNREQEESFGRFYFSSHTFKFFGSPV